MNSSPKTLTIVALFLVLFIDGLGQGILFPILADALINKSTAVLAVNATLETREFLYGLLIGVFFFCWFLGAAVLGDLSDSIGRKKSLLICLIGAAIAYFISAIAFVLNSVLILLIGRIIAGLTAGSQPIAQAAITELSDSKKLARNLGLVLLAVSSGIALGPVISSVLDDSNLISWFNFTTPMYFACILSVLNIILLICFFTETTTVFRQTKIKLSHAISIFISAFKDPSVRHLACAFFFLQMGFNLYYTYSSVYLTTVFDASGFQIGLFMGVLGVGLGIGFIFITRLVETFSPKNIVLIGYAILIVNFILILFTHQLWLLYVYVVISAMGFAVGYTFILTLFSWAASEDKQGWVMGITAALLAFGAGLVNLCIGIMTQAGAIAPFYIDIGITLIGILIILFYQPKDKVYD